MFGNNLNYSLKININFAHFQQQIAQLQRMLNGLQTPQIGGGLLGGGGSSAVSQAISGLGRIGLALNGVQLAFNAAQQVATGFYGALIESNSKFTANLTQTRSAIVATSRVFRDGMQLSSTEAFAALKGPVEQAMREIENRSLKLAGVTSQQLSSVFNIVAGQIGSIGGGLKEATDLTISFAAALGTLNIPLFQANQEIRSILTGQITADSLLAKQLGISNAQVASWKQQGIAVQELTRRLEPLLQGQAEVARTLPGVFSNIQEFGERFGRTVGKPLEQELVTVFTKIQDSLFDDKGPTAFAQNLINNGRKAMEFLIEQVKILGTTFSQTFSEVGQLLANVFGQSANNFSLIENALRGIVQAITFIFDTFNGVLSVVNEQKGIFEDIRKIFDSLVLLGVALFDTIVKAFEYVGAILGLTVDTKTSADGIAVVTSGILDTINQTVQILTFAVRLVERIFDVAKSIFSFVTENIKATIRLVLTSDFGAYFKAVAKASSEVLRPFTTPFNLGGGNPLSRPSAAVPFPSPSTPGVGGNPLLPGGNIEIKPNIEDSEKLKSSLESLNRAITEFIRSLTRRVEDLQLEIKELTVQTQALQRKRQLSDQLRQFGDNFVKNFMDGIEQTLDLIDEAFVSPINTQRRLLQTQREIADLRQRLNDSILRPYAQSRADFPQDRFSWPGQPNAASPSGASRSLGTTRFEGVQVTAAKDSTGEPGLDYVVSNGRRGANFGSLVDGTVIEVVSNQNWETNLETNPNGRRGYGNRVIVRTLDRITGQFIDVLYAHLDKVAVQVGDQVGVGTILGTQGRTGSTYGPHVSVDFFGKDSNRGTPASLRMRDAFARLLQSGQGISRLNTAIGQIALPSVNGKFEEGLGLFNRLAPLPQNSNPARLVTANARVASGKVNDLDMGERLSNGRVALTFDDGPDPAYTRKILAILRKNGVKATFFLVGENIRRHPEIVREILADGHEVGVHSYTHRRLTTLSETEVKSELQRTIQEIQAVAPGYTPRYFRPPYGATNAMIDRVGDSLGLGQALWSTDTQDWNKNTTTDQIYQSLLGARAGSNILLHDGGDHAKRMGRVSNPNVILSRDRMAAALERALPQMLQRGTTFGRLSEGMQLQGTPIGSNVASFVPGGLPAASTAAQANSLDFGSKGLNALLARVVQTRPNEFDLNSPAGRARAVIAAAIAGTEFTGEIAAGGSPDRLAQILGGASNRMLGPWQFNQNYSNIRSRSQGLPNQINFLADILSGRSLTPDSKQQRDFGADLATAISSGQINSPQALEEWLSKTLGYGSGGRNWQALTDGWGRTGGLSTKLFGMLRSSPSPSQNAAGAGGQFWQPRTSEGINLNSGAVDPSPGVQMSQQQLNSLTGFMIGPYSDAIAALGKAQQDKLGSDAQNKLQEVVDGLQRNIRDLSDQSLSLTESYRALVENTTGRPLSYQAEGLRGINTQYREMQRTLEDTLSTQTKQYDAAIAAIQAQSELLRQAQAALAATSDPQEQFRLQSQINVYTTGIQQLEASLPRMIAGLQTTDKLLRSLAFDKAAADVKAFNEAARQSERDLLSLQQATAQIQGDVLGGWAISSKLKLLELQELQENLLRRFADNPQAQQTITENIGEQMRYARAEGTLLGQTIIGLREPISGLVSGLGSVFSTVQSFGDGLRAVGEVLGQFFTNVANQFMQMAAQMLSNMAVNQLLKIFKLGDGPAGPGGLGSLFSLGAGLLGGGGGGLFSQAVSVGFPGTIPFGFPLPMFAEGGVVNRPTVGLIGEAGNEAIVPLSGGRSIPVQIRGGMGQNANISMPISITNNGQAQVSETNASMLGNRLREAVLKVLVEEQRQGGLIAR